MKSFSFARLLTGAGLLLALLAMAGGPSITHAASRSIGVAPAGNTLAISPAQQVQYVEPGQTYTYYYKVYDTNGPATGHMVKLAVASDANWPVAISPAEVFVPANTSVAFKVQVRVPTASSVAGSTLKVGAFASDSSAVAALTLKSIPAPAPNPNPTSIVTP